MACERLPSFEEEQRAVESKEDDKGRDEVRDDGPGAAVVELPVQRQRVVVGRHKVIESPHDQVAQPHVIEDPGEEPTLSISRFPFVDTFLPIYLCGICCYWFQRNTPRVYGVANSPRVVVGVTVRFLGVCIGFNIGTTLGLFRVMDSSDSLS